MLSEAFYTQNTATMSALEAAVWNYLNETDIDPVQLTQTADLYYQWGVLEQFYYMPLIIVLMKAYIRRYQQD